ncbi:MAG: hypothetical protein ACFFDN_22165, partial [Candidatus Hodarchaeota archaeon]
MSNVVQRLEEVKVEIKLSSQFKNRLSRESGKNLRTLKTDILNYLHKLKNGVNLDLEFILEVEFSRNLDNIPFSISIADKKFRDKTFQLLKNIEIDIPRLTELILWTIYENRELIISKNLAEKIKREFSLIKKIFNNYNVEDFYKFILKLIRLGYSINEIETLFLNNQEEMKYYDIPVEYIDDLFLTVE